jgi:hypothetical protein
MKFNENKATLIWLSEELRKHESKKGHATIVIEVMDGKAHRIEPGEKILVQNMIKCP